VFKDVKHDLESLEGVSEIHDLHIWSLTIGKPALSVHVKSNEDPHV
jgi:Co/Zn/Cd efflux system component